MLRFAIPSKGSGYDKSVALLEQCGLRISRATPRQYTARLRGLSDTELLLHRPEDIVKKVAAGDIDIGITGIDLVREHSDDEHSILILYEDLGFWRVELAIAAPQTWIDVNSWQDLADLSVEFQNQGKPLRIATKFPNLTRRFCYRNGINVFHLVPSEGATEAAPGLGYADVIADVVETGTALRDNQLKIVGGPVIRSQACMIGSRRSLRGRPDRLELVRQVLDLLEAQQRARGLHSLIANIEGESIEAVARLVTERPGLAGLRGPTVAPVWDKHDPHRASSTSRWYAVNVVVPQEELMHAVDHLRHIGASTVTVTAVHYAFQDQSAAYTSMLERLQDEP
jgi:ATP phosphoribosyltransferase